MKIKLLFLALSFLMVSCSLSFDLGSKTSTDRKLYKSHTYSQKTEDIIFFYDVKIHDNKQYVDIILKNKSHFLMSSLSIKISYDNNIDSDFIRLGSIINGGMKSFNIVAPIEARKMNLDFEYQLSRQDSFLRTESYGGQSEHKYGVEDVESKEGHVELYLKR